MAAGARISIVDEDWTRSAELLDLVYDVLYRDFGVERDRDWLHAAPGSQWAVALDSDDVLLGVARLLPAAGERSRQLRQVAVLGERRRVGVGSQLVRALEQRAATEHAQELWLNARDSAFDFYEALGYEYAGPPFVSELTAIPHRRMLKRLR
jgi:hypothetical protein